MASDEGRDDGSEGRGDEESGESADRPSIGERFGDIGEVTKQEDGVLFTVHSLEAAAWLKRFDVRTGNVDAEFVCFECEGTLIDVANEQAGDFRMVFAVKPEGARILAQNLMSVVTTQPPS